MENLLEVKNLTTRFHTFDGIVHALNGVTFHVGKGEILAVVGESGSGKSVAMMSILGLLPSPPATIDAGSAKLFTKDTAVDLLTLSKAEMNRVRGRQIGFIFQDALSALNPVMTVGSQISETLVRHLDFSWGRARTRTIELMNQVGIPGAAQRLNQYPHQFSGGMRQRVMIALAAACRPRLLIADEPTTALDVTVQAQILELVLRLQREMDLSLIWITHDLGVVAGLADRVLVMYAGRPVETAPVDTLYDHPLHPYTRGLLRAVPSLDRDTKAPLESIEGLPPDLLSPPCHCQFAWRCPCVFDRCWQDNPPYLEVAPGHIVTCFYDLDNGRPH
ncbi:MAG: peptide ABC transporter ATP-binding protein [Desulfobacterales bacterium RIFOXYA12_FULL_46_15]|nr:MAG: peptide ABC transporter ATP-binding protein [Desulfobacterales bacterium RIFOXYA12_FULL_46_15]